MFEHGQIVRRGPCSRAHLVVAEGHVHGPVQAVLDGPVGANGVGDAPGVGSQAADVEALFAGGLVADDPFRFEHGKAA